MVVHCLCVIILTIYLSTLIRGISAQGSGPYEIVLESIADCDDKGSGEITVSSSASTNEAGKSVLTGDLKLPHGITDQMKATGDAFIKANGVWKPMGLVYKMSFAKACSSIKSLAPIWFGLLKAADIEKPGCPVPEGTHHFKNYRIPGKVANLNSLRYGQYRIRLCYFKGNKKIGCLCYIANVVPK